MPPCLVSDGESDDQHQQGQVKAGRIDFLQLVPEYFIFCNAGFVQALSLLQGALASRVRVDGRNILIAAARVYFRFCKHNKIIVIS
jgi:hypothetical protein